VPDLAVKPTDTVAVKRYSLGPDAPTRCLGLAFHKDQIKTRLIDELYDALYSVIEDAKG